jgi:hypothetical protein
VAWSTNSLRQYQPLPKRSLQLSFVSDDGVIAFCRVANLQLNPGVSAVSLDDSQLCRLLALSFLAITILLLSTYLLIRIGGALHLPQSHRLADSCCTQDARHL